MRTLPVVAVLLSVLLTGRASAADPGAVEEAVAAGRAAMERSALESKSGESSTRPETALPAPPGDVAMNDPATRKKYLAAMQRYYDYRHNGYEFRSRVFEWQLLSSRVIFVIVVLLVLAGIYFAAVQFHVALAAARGAATQRVTAGEKRAAAEGQASPITLATQLEVSAKGIVVNSSVLGVVILALSLAFFYLYLVYVYPIRDVL